MKTLLFVVVGCLITFCNGTLQDITRARIETGENGITRYDFKTPFVLDGPLVDRFRPNGIEDSHFVHDYLREDSYSVHQFSINNNHGIVTGHSWVPSCEEYKDRYVHIALLGPKTDSRFKVPTEDYRDKWNINWDLPTGYGAVFGVHPKIPSGEKRYTLNITLPPGTFPDRWYIPYNSGDQDPGCRAFQAYKNDTSTGVLGCGFPPERCPGAPYPFNYTASFCPHYKVGNFCGSQPWRWINERDLKNGTYFLVYWEAKGHAVDFSSYTGWDETLGMGKFDTPQCRGYNAFDLPPSCMCGQRDAMALPRGCLALFPANIQRSFLLYSLLNGGSTLHTKCKWINNNPRPI